jgi:hypothetical protein
MADDCRSFPCSKVIGSAGGTLEIQGFKLTVPANAVTSNTTFTVDKYSAPAITGFREDSDVFELSPHGKDFYRDVNIDVPYSPLSAGASMYFSTSATVTIIDPLGWVPGPAAQQKYDARGNFNNCDADSFDKYFVIVGEET